MTIQEAVSALSGEQQQNIAYLRSLVATQCPTISRALRLIDADHQAARRPKGYGLVKVKNKKRGFVYYVRYYQDGGMIRSKWSTHTNDYEKACEFARSNRKALIERYQKESSGEAERFFSNFYDPESAAFQEERLRYDISDPRRKRYKSVIMNKFIPFLQERKIRAFAEITTPVLDDFQDSLLKNGVKAQTANDEILAVTKAFKYMTRKGIIQNNPCLNLTPVPEKPEDKKTHGCYELESLKGVFDRQWEDKRSLLLNMMIYTTDMRNSEIERLCKKDIVTINDCRFIHIKKSKTGSGIRFVPLHEKVYRQLTEYSEGMDESETFLRDPKKRQFSKACNLLGKMMGADEDFLKKNNITFYSGRHAWKTMMSAGGLGEGAEEVFMGHKVSSDVAKLYNHRDKQGREQIEKKAREIFSILDKMLFQ
jgi:integrase